MLIIGFVILSPSSKKIEFFPSIFAFQIQSHLKCSSTTKPFLPILLPDEKEIKIYYFEIVLNKRRRSKVSTQIVKGITSDSDTKEIQLSSQVVVGMLMGIYTR